MIISRHCHYRLPHPWSWRRPCRSSWGCGCTGCRSSSGGPRWGSAPARRTRRWSSPSLPRGNNAASGSGAPSASGLSAAPLWRSWHGLSSVRWWPGHSETPDAAKMSGHPPHLDAIWLVRVVTGALWLLPLLAGQHAAALAGELSPDHLAAVHLQPGEAVAAHPTVPPRHGLQVLSILYSNRWQCWQEDYF